MSDETTKREETPTRTGNTAALREVLEKLLDYWARCDVTYPPEKRLRGMAEAALAAPPRNCDRFATLKDAQEAFFPCYIPCYTQTRVGAFLDWIFAPAAQEGGQP